LEQYGSRLAAAAVTKPAACSSSCCLLTSPLPACLQTSCKTPYDALPVLQMCFQVITVESCNMCCCCAGVGWGGVGWVHGGGGTPGGVKAVVLLLQLLPPGFITLSNDTKYTHKSSSVS
jgi:hypothetical protein